MSAEKMRKALESIRSALRVDDPHGHYDLVCEALAQVDRHELQSKGQHPAPCARFCEATAFGIEIRGLQAEIHRLRSAQAEQRSAAPPAGLELHHYAAIERSVEIFNARADRYLKARNYTAQFEASDAEALLEVLAWIKAQAEQRIEVEGKYSAFANIEGAQAEQRGEVVPWHKDAAKAVMAALVDFRGFYMWWYETDAKAGDEIMDAIATAIADQAPPAPVVPDGWKLVPVEPTDEMIDAGCREVPAYREDIVPAWDAMLASAPEMPNG